MIKRNIILIPVLCVIFMTAFFFHKDKKIVFSEKTEPMSELGDLTAFDNGKIYYFSHEGEKHGIYCMNENGENVQFITASNRIGRIQIRDGTLYFTEFQEERLWKKESIAIFRLCKYELNNKTKKYIDLYPEDETYEENSTFRNVWDFYVLEDNKILIANIDFKIPSFEKGYDFFLADTERNEVIQSKEIEKNVIKIEDYKLIFYNELLVMIKKDPHHVERNSKQWMADVYEEISFYDMKKQRPVIPTHGMPSSKKSGLTIQMMKDGLIFVSYRDQWEVINVAEKKSEEIFSLPKYGYIKWIKEGENEMWLLAGGANAGPVSSSSKLYQLDLKAGTFHLADTLKEKETCFLYKGNIIRINRKKVSLFKLTNGKLKKEKEIRLPRLEADKKIKLEICGEWLFVYQFGQFGAEVNPQYKIKWNA